MATLTEIVEGVTAIGDAVLAIDTKLDDVAAKIAGLEGGSVVSQDDLDALAALVQGVKDQISAVKSEADTLA